MSHSKRPSFLKRQKEMNRKQKQLDKAARRLARKEERDVARVEAVAPAANTTPDGRLALSERPAARLDPGLRHR